MSSATLINPDLRGARRFAVRLCRLPLYAIWKEFLATLAVTGGGAAAAFAVAPLAGGGYIFTAAIVWISALVYAEDPNRSLSDVGLGGYLAKAAGIGLKRYEHECKPHVDATTRSISVLGRIVELASEHPAIAETDVVAAAERLAWSASLRRRAAFYAVPTLDDFEADERFAEVADHTEVAELLEAELEGLLDDTEAAAAAVLDPTVTSGALHGEFAAVALSQMARESLGIRAASALAVDPAREAAALIERGATS